MPFKLHAVIAGLALLIGSARAGGGANVGACVWFPTIAKSMVITFHPCAGGTHCMSECPTTEISMSVTTAGLTCVDISYMETKNTSSGGDTCWTDYSFMQLNYSDGSGLYSGGVRSQWSGGNWHNHATVVVGSSSPKTAVCSSRVKCTGTDTDWDAQTVGKVYYVFQPSLVGSGFMAKYYGTKEEVTQQLLKHEAEAEI
jgi:hypothetical protein